jgi:hypothetical protein
MSKSDLIQLCRAESIFEKPMNVIHIHKEEKSYDHMSCQKIYKIQYTFTTIYE